MSEWLLFNFSNKFSEFTALNFAVSILIIGITSVVISLCLFVWVSSAGPKEIKFFKLMIRPIFLPFIWILTMIFNLLFTMLKTETDNTEQITKLNFLDIIKNKFLKLKGVIT